MKNLAQWLVQQRKLKKLSKAQLAQRLNQPISYIDDVEHAKHILDIMQFLNYCHALNADPKFAIEIIQHELQNHSNNDDCS